MPESPSLESPIEEAAVPDPPRIVDEAENSDLKPNSDSVSEEQSPIDTNLHLDSAENSPVPSLEQTPPISEQFVQELIRMREQIDLSSQEILRSFQDKLAFDQHKEKQIDLLHSELQEHKRNLVARAVQPLVSGLVRLHDALGRTAENLAGESSASDPERYRILFEEFQEDVEILLEENGISLFTAPQQRFDPHTQTSRRTIATDDPELVGSVARRVRPGFDQDGKLIQKERVDVYVRS